VSGGGRDNWASARVASGGPKWVKMAQLRKTLIFFYNSIFLYFVFFILDSKFEFGSF
jgi:hypothetical protein